MHLRASVLCPGWSHCLGCACPRFLLGGFLCIHTSSLSANISLQGSLLTAPFKLDPLSLGSVRIPNSRSRLPGLSLSFWGPAQPGVQWAFGKRMLMNSCLQGDVCRGPENAQQGSGGVQGGGLHPLGPHCSKQGPCASNTATARELATEAESQARSHLLKHGSWS